MLYCEICRRFQSGSWWDSTERHDAYEVRDLSYWYRLTCHWERTGLTVKGFQWCPSVRMTTFSDPENKLSPPLSPFFFRLSPSFFQLFLHHSHEVMNLHWRSVAFATAQTNSSGQILSISSSSKTVIRRPAAKSILGIRYGLSVKYLQFPKLWGIHSIVEDFINALDGEF